MEQIDNYYMYVLLCADDTLYTGFSTDVERRFQQHVKGVGAKYTRSHRPVKILWKEQFDSKHDALSAEYAFKQLSRAKKIQYLAKVGIHLQWIIEQATKSSENYYQEVLYDKYSVRR